MQFVFKETKNWKNLALRWIPRIHEGGILYYEDLLQDKRKHFRVLMQYLGLEMDERRLECVLKHDFVEFKRKSDRPTGNNNTTTRFQTILMISQVLSCDKKIYDKQETF